MEENHQPINQIEIRQRKKLVVPFLLLLVITLIGTGYGFFFMEKHDTTSKISFWGGVALALYIVFPGVKKLIKNEWIIAMDNDSIILNDKKIITIPKSEIEQIDVTSNDDGYFLNIKTKEKKKPYSISISWLDKTPDEIEKLISGYRK